MKEIRDYQIKVRLTQTEKMQVQEYAAARSLTISEVVRQALKELIGGIKK